MDEFQKKVKLGYFTKLKQNENEIQYKLYQNNILNYYKTTYYQLSHKIENLEMTNLKKSISKRKKLLANQNMFSDDDENASLSSINDLSLEDSFENISCGKTSTESFKLEDYLKNQNFSNELDLSIIENKKIEAQKTTITKIKKLVENPPISENVVVPKGKSSKLSTKVKV